MNTKTSPSLHTKSISSFRCFQLRMTNLYPSRSIKKSAAACSPVSPLIRFSVSPFCSHFLNHENIGENSFKFSRAAKNNLRSASLNHISTADFRIILIQQTYLNHSEPVHYELNDTGGASLMG